VLLRPFGLRPLVLSFTCNNGIHPHEQAIGMVKRIINEVRKEFLMRILINYTLIYDGHYLGGRTTQNIYFIKGNIICLKHFTACSIFIEIYLQMHPGGGHKV
jgi:hypothetical protein